jgi:hypothetical protein
MTQDNDPQMPTLPPFNRIDVLETAQLPSKPRLLVIGHGRHGKDTVCEILRDYHGYSFVSSSQFVLDEAIWENWGQHRYKTKDICYADRANHRDKWADMITEYNTPDKSKTASGMLDQGYSIYCGMRRRDEFEAARHLFDAVVWVDRSELLPPEPFTSMELNKSDANIFIDNNSTKIDLWFHVFNASAKVCRDLN